MTHTLTAVFDGQVLRPDTPPDLEPNTRYTITVQGTGAPTLPPGVPGRDLLRFAGTWPKEDLEEVRAAIEEGCEHVDTSAEEEDAWDVLERLIGTVAAPPDWSNQPDHYLYGTPKHENEADS